jgi:hypothetical protein
MDKTAGYAKVFRNLADGATLVAQTADRGGINDDARPTECLPLGASVPQSGPDALYDQAAFEFGDSAQDGKDHLAGRRGRVHLLTQTDECDAEGVEGFERPKQVRDGSSEPIETPDGHHVKASLVGIGHQTVKLRPGIFRATHSSINVRVHHLPAACFRELLEIPRL